MLKPDVELGRKAVEAIEQAGIHVRSAAWAFFREAQEWRLLLIMWDVQRYGPRHVYEKLAHALERASVELPLEAVAVAAPNDPLGRLVAAAPKMASPFRGGVVTSTSGPAADVKINTRYIIR
jgi:hypothetical protein